MLVCVCVCVRAVSNSKIVMDSANALCPFWTLAVIVRPIYTN